MGERGIVLANTGTPDAPEPQAVRRYLAAFLADPRICPMNPVAWRFILHAFILPRRSTASAAKYRRIWTEDGSPLAVHMTSLAQRLDEALGHGSTVRCAMSYGAPSMEDALSELRSAGCDEVIVVPLYPQSALSTTQVVADKAQTALAALGWQPRMVVVPGYSSQPLYLEALVSCIRAAGFDAATGDRLLFAFHSIPMADVRRGDAYGEQAHATAEAVAHALGSQPGEWAIGFQCRFDSRAWLGPFTSEALETLGEVPGTLHVIAPNFAVDCLETLYDIDIELREAYQERAAAASEGDAPRAARPFRYLPCLNDGDAHVRVLQAVVEGALGNVLG